MQFWNFCSSRTFTKFSFVQLSVMFVSATDDKRRLSTLWTYKNDEYKSKGAIYGIRYRNTYNLPSEMYTKHFYFVCLSSFM